MCQVKVVADGDQVVDPLCDVWCLPVRDGAQGYVTCRKSTSCNALAIRVRVCFDDPESDAPVDCSAALIPTSEVPSAESSASSPVPKDSINYVEVDGQREAFVLAGPNPTGTPPASATDTRPT